MTDAALTPRMFRIRDAIRYSGVSRTRMYELAAANPHLFRKIGPKIVLVDRETLDRILDGLTPSKMG